MTSSSRVVVLNVVGAAALGSMLLDVGGPWRPFLEPLDLALAAVLAVVGAGIGIAVAAGRTVYLEGPDALLVGVLSVALLRLATGYHIPSHLRTSAPGAAVLVGLSLLAFLSGLAIAKSMDRRPTAPPSTPAAMH